MVACFPIQERNVKSQTGAMKMNSMSIRGCGATINCPLSPYCPWDQRKPTETLIQPFPHCETLESGLNSLSLELFLCEMGSTTSLLVGTGGGE